jgi:sugar phosphate isomerase/epimerase
MSAMTLRDRIGVDLGGRRRLEDGLAWAAAHGVRYVDACLEGAPDHPNAPATWTAERVAALRATCERHGIHLGLHSASAVNVAETSPLLAEAADQYLRTYVDLAGRLGAEWIVVHGGYHFTGDFAARLSSSVERLGRAAAHAEGRGVRLLLENLNREPEHAEIRYLAHDLEECREYFGRIQSPALGWAFTVNHAHLVPEGVDGFLDAMDLGRCGEVRLADSHGRYEQHLRPGEGTIDFPRMFQRIEGGHYRGHYMMAFGSPDDMLAGRETLLNLAAGAAGVRR